MYELYEKLLKYKNILFDLDNTIYDQKEYDFYIYKKFLNDESLALKLIFFKEEKGYGYNTLFNDFIKKEKLNINPDVMTGFYRNFLPDISDIESIFEILKKLKDNGKKLYIISNGRRKNQIHKIRLLKIADFFEKIIILDPKEKIALKPSSEILELLKLNLKETVYIGDNIGIDGGFAKNCGIDYLFFKFESNLIKNMRFK